MRRLFICLNDHSENTRWHSWIRDGLEGCGKQFIVDVGPKSPMGTACPFCGALYVKDLGQAK